ncbi:MAG: DUF364 domain-containing protein [Deltaproteobacteria bacterium]|nr:DUF364 domain-containing protein [Deltaproteobacteria bacterium]
MDFSSPKWRLYDLLVALTPPTATVEAAAFGPYWAALKSSQGGTGLAHILPHKNPSPRPDPQSLVGRPLKELALLIKSWDLVETALGLAAINATANSALLNQGLTATSKEAGAAAFDCRLQKATGQKVAVIGHFPKMDNLKAAAKEFYVFERDPQSGDLPDPAVEYLLPAMDVVFITGSSLANKTLPRLLELAAKAWVGLVGPSVPLIPDLFQEGIDSLSGTVFHDFPQIAKAIGEGIASSLFRYGGFRINLGPDFKFKRV